MGPTTQEAVLKLVPTEPTAEMLTAAAPYCRQSLTRAADIYRAMVARAPTPEPMQADMRETIAGLIRQHVKARPSSRVMLERITGTYEATDAILAAMQAKSEPVQIDEFELAGVLQNTGVVIGSSTWPDEQRRDAVRLAEAAINALEPHLAHPSPSAPNPDLAGLVEALREYDEAVSGCPVRQDDPRSRDKCRSCGARPDQGCGKDNPYKIVEAARHLASLK